MVLLGLLVLLEVIDLISGIIISIINNSYESRVMKNGCLKKVAILLLGVGSILVSTYFPQFNGLEYSIVPFIITEVTSLKENYKILTEVNNHA